MAKSSDIKWSDLTQFEFTKFDVSLVSTSENIYRNGRQQAAVEAIVRITSFEIPDENGMPGEVPLSAKELASVRLVAFRGDELSSEWKISRVRNEYSPFPGVLEGEQSRKRDDGPDALKNHYVDMFVSTTAAAGQRFKMALAITRDDGKVFISNGEGTPSNPFEVTLVPQPIPNFPVGNFSFEKTRVKGGEGSDVFIDNYYVGLADNGNVAVPLLKITSVPAGMIQWAEKIQGETFASYTGYGDPGSTVALFNNAINYGAHSPSKVVISPKQSFATILLVADNNILYHSDSANKQAGPCDITVTDAYGNEHALRVRFKQPGSPEGRFDLVLEKR
ncbi:hypothetical protein [Stenotrophomonas sp. PS02289]|uniref:hypothetical protein n=1 Tax=Stenotrophomonas sp. PS02289 TaxID=2991422 RepID=UPI00249BB508|nr:hypothetical protein [Stenotrophomonas sp. PS02289]